MRLFKNQDKNQDNKLHVSCVNKLRLKCLAQNIIGGNPNGGEANPKTDLDPSPFLRKILGRHKIPIQRLQTPK